MGWKNVKEHYGITHIVQVTDNGMCIGSAYVHDIIVIDANGAVTQPHNGIGQSGQFARWRAAMEGDKAALLRLIEDKDTFAISLPVFTYNGGDIIEEACEEYEWPNVTHAGHLMYENRFSADKSQVVTWAKRNAAAGVELMTDSIADAETRLNAMKTRRRTYQSNLAKLCAGYPDPADVTTGTAPNYYTDYVDQQIADGATP